MRNFFRNLLSGLKLSLFRKVRPADFHISLGQAVALLALDLLLTIISDHIRIGWLADFNLWGFASYSLGFALLLLACVAVARLCAMPYLVLELLVVIASAQPILYLPSAIFDTAYHVAAKSDAAWFAYAIYIYYAVLAWLAVIFFRCLQILSARRLPRLMPVVAVFCVISILPLFYLPRAEFWLASAPVTELVTRPQVNAEQVFYAQPKLVATAAQALLPERAGVTDLYFIGAGSYAQQDVFMKEVRYVRDLFDRRFDSQGRSVALINNAQTIADTPIASASNLALLLDHIGTVMNPQEDILFLFITTHGSEQHELSTDFWPLALNAITPTQLHSMLRHAGIQWRVLVISACYSGGFIDALKDEYSLIITAARADKMSFGCSNENDFTYFGEAYFKDQLSKQPSFTLAFQEAIKAIAAREKKEGIEASYPQMHLGRLMQGKLLELEERLARSAPHDG